MQRIEHVELATVVAAGSSTTSTDTPLVRTQTTQTDYAKCVDTVVRQTATQYPSTQPWWNPFGTDTNAGPRARATVDNMRRVCGLPPA